LDYHLNKAKIKCEKKNITKIGDKKMFKCSECDVMFTRLCNLKKHKLNKHSTTNKKTDLEILEDHINININKLIEEKMNQMNQMAKQITMLQTELLNQNKTPQTVNNTINNTVNNNNNTMNIVNIINVNGYGNENRDYIDKYLYERCIGRPSDFVPNLILNIHFNPDYPENHNVVPVDGGKMFNVYFSETQFKLYSEIGFLKLFLETINQKFKEYISEFIKEGKLVDSTEKYEARLKQIIHESTEETKNKSLSCASNSKKALQKGVKIFNETNNNPNIKLNYVIDTGESVDPDLAIPQ
jgi:hypothetical protein